MEMGPTGTHVIPLPRSTCIVYLQDEMRLCTDWTTTLPPRHLLSATPAEAKTNIEVGRLDPSVTNTKPHLQSQVFYTTRASVRTIDFKPPLVNHDVLQGWRNLGVNRSVYAVTSGGIGRFALKLRAGTPPLSWSLEAFCQNTRCVSKPTSSFPTYKKKSLIDPWYPNLPLCSVFF